MKRLMQGLLDFQIFRARSNLMRKNKINATYNQPDFIYNGGSQEKASEMLFNNLIWMTTEEAAFYLRKSANAIRLLVFKGHLKSRKFQRRLYFKRDELNNLIETAFVT